MIDLHLMSMSGGLMFIEGKTYTRDVIHDTLGGSKQAYLPTHEGRVVCGAFRRDANPDAPNVVLVGRGPRIRATAEILEHQASAIPIFVKKDTNAWEFVGTFRLRAVSSEAGEITRHEERANRRGDVSKLLFFERSS